MQYELAKWAVLDRETRRFLRVEAEGHQDYEQFWELAEPPPYEDMPPRRWPVALASVRTVSLAADNKGAQYRLFVSHLWEPGWLAYAFRGLTLASQIYHLRM